MSTVFTANAIAELLAERVPNLGEAQTMQIMESLREAGTIGADITTPRQFILSAIDKAAAPYRTHTPPDPAVALDQAVRDHLARSLGVDWASKYLGVEKTRIYSAAEAIMKERMAPAGNREQEYLDKLHGREATPAERITAARLREQDEAAKGGTPAKSATVALPTGDAAARLTAVNRSNQIARLSREMTDAKAAASNGSNTLNLRTFAADRVTKLTAQLEALGVTVS